MARSSTCDGRNDALTTLTSAMRACRICVENPSGPPLPHEPRPVFRLSSMARLLICGQAPGARVHRCGIPFQDPSGRRLRQWLGIDEDQFYDETKVAILPMGFCYPGTDPRGGDRPPRPECASLWRRRVLEAMPQIALTVLVGQHAIRWHAPQWVRHGIAGSVRGLIDALSDGGAHPRMIGLPHPSWRNNHWLSSNPWFEAGVVPVLQSEVRAVLGPASGLPAGGLAVTAEQD